MYYSLVPIVALLIGVLMNIDLVFERKKNNTFGITYLLLLLFVFLFYIFDLLWGFLDGLENKTPAYIVTALYFFAMSYTVFAWMLYVANCFKERKVFNHIFAAVGSAFLVSGILIIVINFFQPILFDYGSGSYAEKPVRNGFLGMQFVAYVLSAIYAIYTGLKTKESISKSRRFGIAAYGIIMAVAIFLQIFFPLLPIYSIGCAVGLTTVRVFVIQSERHVFLRRIDESSLQAQRSEQELLEVRDLAERDPLTGAKNKYAYVELEEKIDRSIHDQAMGAFAIFVFDLNDLKYINDHFGHEAGDQYIKDSCALISSFFPNSDIFRFGGDEFVALVQGEDYENRYQTAEKINRAIEKNFDDISKPVFAFGLADFNQGVDNTFRSVFTRADDRMYGHKRMIKEKRAALNQANPPSSTDKADIRQTLYESFYYYNEKSLVSLLDALTSDLTIEVDLADDSYQTLFRLEGKYFDPVTDSSYRSLYDFVSRYVVHPEDKDLYDSFMNPENFLQRLASGRIPNFDFVHLRYRLQNGGYRFVEQAVITGEEFGIAPGKFRVYVFDIQNLKSRQIVDTSGVSSGFDQEYDPLTKLLTSKRFFARAEKLVGKQNDTPWCLACADIEHFKFFNELIGREAGDALLQEYGKALSESAAEFGGLASYFGGDDFALLFPYSKEKIEMVYHRLHTILTSNGKYAGFLPALGVSMVEGEKDILDAYDHASVALLSAKSDLRNRIRMYDAKTQDAEAKEFEILLETMNALQNDEITFYLQPQVRISSETLVGAEALARWIQKDGSVVTPSYFIPVLERHGFITNLDQYLWEKVCQWIRSWLDKGHKAIPISVNVSRSDILNLDVCALMETLCKKYSVPHNLLKIEITESSYADISKDAKELITKLRSKGFKVLMDDFGSGYSSLNMFSSLEMDAIKLDADFLRLEEGEAKRGIHVIESVINMAKTTSVPIIMEGVESKEQADFLQGMGCSYAQGYYFYHPMPVEEFEKLLSKEKMIDSRGIVVKRNEQFRIREFLDKNVYSDSMLNRILGSVAIYALRDDCHVDIVRYNEQFYEAVNVPDFSELLTNIETLLPEEDKNDILRAMREAKQNRLGGASGTFRFAQTDGRKSIFQIHFFYLDSGNNIDRFYGKAYNITNLMDYKDICDMIGKYGSENLVIIKRVSSKWVYHVISHGAFDVVGLDAKGIEDEMNDGRFAKRIDSGKSLKTLMKRVANHFEKDESFEEKTTLKTNMNTVVPLILHFRCVKNEANNIDYILKVELDKGA